MTVVSLRSLSAMMGGGVGDGIATGLGDTLLVRGPAGLGDTLLASGAAGFGDTLLVSGSFVPTGLGDTLLVSGPFVATGLGDALLATGLSETLVMTAGDTSGGGGLVALVASGA